MPERHRLAPVGVFDSGVGGLSVLQAIHQQLPGESLLYLADSAHVPYGEKSPDYIRDRCQRIAAFLRAQGAKALVVACNTATAAAVAELRQRYPDWPVLGMEPAVKPAARATRSGVIGVLATSGTLNSARFAALLDRFASGIRVVTVPCPGLVELIERGPLDSPALRQLLARFVAPLREAGCDTLILGCTHYPFIRPLLRELLPEDWVIIDTGPALARHLQARLESLALASPASGNAEVRFWTSAGPGQLQALLPQLWAGPVAGIGRFDG